MDWQQFDMFALFVGKNHKKSKISLWMDIYTSTLKYNISILEYFQFSFFEISKEIKETYVGTGYMYEYQLQMNPLINRSFLEDKVIFNDHYKEFIKHKSTSLAELKENAAISENFLVNHKKLVLKDSKGQCGIGISIIESSTIKSKGLVNALQKTGNDMVESYIEQHKNLAQLSSSGLNTIRVITQLTKDGKVAYLGARLRITVNSMVDNLAAGNLAAAIDIDSGIVSEPAVYSDITKQEEGNHPVTGIKITGFQIPYWDEVLKLTKNAALFDTNNSSIGWDVAITDDGPELLEGNHDWCNLLWQLPVKKGLKIELEKYRIGIK